MEDFRLDDSSTSPASSRRPFDEFLREPGYLEYQEELRCLIFNTAQTAAPSREGSPALAQHSGTLYSPEEQQEAQEHLQAALSSGRRLEYLKNWVAEVARWVSSRTTATSKLEPSSLMTANGFTARHVR